MRAAKAVSQKLGEFLEWLLAGEFDPNIGPIHLAYYPYMTERPVYAKQKKPGELFPSILSYEPIPRDEWRRQGQLESVTYQIEPLLARFFEIDLNKVEAEKRALLDQIRKLQE